MNLRSRNQARHRPVIDLTHSESESLCPEPHFFSQPPLPEPSHPNRPRRLTAWECIRADRIARGEIDAPSPSDLFPQNTSPLSDHDTLDLTNERTEANLHDAEPAPSAPYKERSATTRGIVNYVFQREIGSHKAPNGLADVPCVEDESPEQPVEQPQSDTSLIIIGSSSEAGDSSDDEFVLYGEKDIIDLTKLEDDEQPAEPEVVEIMANGRPRRACAPKSFEGLIATKGRKLVKRAIEASTVTLTSEERALADKYRDDLLNRGMAAHIALWQNRLVRKFSYNCGRIDVGRARAALVHMGHLIGALPKVVKRQESGSCAKYVVMEAGKRLCAPMEQDIREVADKLIDRAFANTAQKKAKTKKKTKRKVPESEATKRAKNARRRGKRREKRIRELQKLQRMTDVAQGVKRDENAFDRVVPIQVEIQREDIKEETRMEQEDIRPNRSLVPKEEPQPLESLQTSRTPNNNRDNERKRKFDSRGDALQSNENGRTTWERKRQRNLEGTKIETGNKGFAMLAKMGWRDGQGLGAKRNGISEPIVAEFRSGRRGLGTQ